MKDSNDTIRIDSVTINVTPCFNWPRLIASGGEAFQVSCNSKGHVLASFWGPGKVNLVNDTIYTVPVGYNNQFLFLNKYANRLWFKALYTYAAPTFQQELVDNQGNSYILFFTDATGYSFYNGPSGSTGFTSQFLAKIDINGNVVWVQSFSDGSNYSLIQSFCLYGDSIYLAGNTTTGSIMTELNTASQPQSWSVNYNPSQNYLGDFICLIKSHNGAVDTLSSFINSTSTNGNYITSLHDTILIVNNGWFYQFPLNINNPINQQPVFSPPYFTKGGWINNGLGKIIVFEPGCAVDNNGSFYPPSWTNRVSSTNYNYTGFATSSILYMTYMDNNDSCHFTRWDLGTGLDMYSQDPAAPWWSYITGNKDLPFGYNMSYTEYYNDDTIKIDTFGLPYAIPKCVKILPDSNNKKLPSNVSNYQEVSIFPNPTSNTLILNVDPKIKGTINSIEILNSTGSLIETINGNPSVESYKINLEEFPNGIYLIIVKTEARDFMNKVIKMN